MKKIFLGLLVLLISCNKSTKKAEIIITDSIKEYTPKVIIDNLPNKLNEQSGLELFNNLIWVNNDSGGENKIFGFNLNGEIKQEITISNAENKDWESLACDNKYMYIGDFGNNNGNRKDLKVFRISLPDSNKEKINKKADIYNISWSDQKDFTYRSLANNYDCEGFFAYNDSLYFFSKNWLDYKTRMYVCSSKPGDYDMSPQAVFNVGFSVTGADISPNGKYVALVGYKYFKTYLVIFYDYKGNDFFSGKHISLYLKSLKESQTEGLMFVDNNKIYISCEKTDKFSHKVYEINLNELFSK